MCTVHFSPVSDGEFGFDFRKEEEINFCLVQSAGVKMCQTGVPSTWAVRLFFPSRFWGLSVLLLRSMEADQFFFFHIYVKLPVAVQMCIR